MVLALEILTNFLSALSKSSLESSRLRCSRRNQTAPGTTRNIMLPQATVGQPKAMPAQNSVVGPVMIPQNYSTKLRTDVRRPEPNLACAVSTV
jgi:hypothetical protein